MNNSFFSFLHTATKLYATCGLCFHPDYLYRYYNVGRQIYEPPGQTLS